MATYSDRWKTAKNDFEKLTGTSKPKPDGAFAKAFNSSGLTKAISTADDHCAKLKAGFKVSEQDKKKKAIADAGKYGPVLTKATGSYITTLDKAIDNEVTDKKGKTVYSRGLKVLREELKFIDKDYQQRVDREVVQLKDDLSNSQKGAALTGKALQSTLAYVYVTIKNIKAKPTIAEWNKHFGSSVSDTCARKLQVQLVALDKGRKSGDITVNLRADPRSVADDLTPFQAGGKGQCVLPNDADEAAVTARLVEFARIAKLARSIVEEVAAAG